MIPILEGLDRLVTETKGMLAIAKDYYKDLFSAEGRPDIRLMADFFSLKKK
jgi:hypothetical protein